MVSKPTIGQDPWGATLNASLDELQAGVDAKSDTAHTHNYVPTSDKGAINGVATLDATGVVPRAQVGSGFPSTSKYLRGDGSWQEIPAGAHGALTGLTADDHPQYLNSSRGDGRYYTQAQTDAKLAAVSLGGSITILESQVTGLTSDLAAKASSTHVHAGADITSGTVPVAQLPTGTSGSTVALGNHVHAGADITSGTVPIARIPTGTSGVTVALGNHDHAGVYAPVSHTHAAADIASGTVATARLGSGSAGAANWLRGDQSWTAPVASEVGAIPSARTLNAQTGTTYTLVLTDADKVITAANASAITLTVPPNSSVAWPVGKSCVVAQTGAGQVTVAPGAAVTLNSTPGLKIAAQYGTIELLKIATDTWLVFGRLSA